MVLDELIIGFNTTLGRLIGGDRDAPGDGALISPAIRNGTAIAANYFTPAVRLSLTTSLGLYQSAVLEKNLHYSTPARILPDSISVQEILNECKSAFDAAPDIDHLCTKCFEEPDYLRYPEIWRLSCRVYTARGRLTGGGRIVPHLARRKPESEPRAATPLPRWRRRR